MKAKELIEKLKLLDSEKEVYILDCGDNPFDGGCPIEKSF